MPIIIKVNPVRVEEVQIDADSDLWEQVLLSIWPIVRRHLKRLNRSLGRNAQRFIRELEGYDSKSLLTKSEKGKGHD